MTLGFHISFLNRTVEKSLFEEPKVIELSRKHNKTPAQIILRHAIQLGIAVIVKSDIREEIVSNFDVSSSDKMPKSCGFYVILDCGF